MTNGPLAPPAGGATALPALERVALAAVHVPARRSGDVSWFDAVSLAGGRVALVVAETEHRGGVAPLRQAMLAALRPGVPSPSALDAFERAAEAGEWTGGCVVLDGAAEVLHWLRAGRGPAPVLVGPDGARRRRRIPRTGRVVESVEPGTTVVLCRVGRTARGTRSADAVVRLVADTAVRCHGLAPQALAPELLRAVDDRLGSDGLVLLLARVLPAPLHERLPADPGFLPAVRRRVDGWSAQAGLPDDTASDLQLMLSEAVSNAVEHAYRDRTAGELVYAVRRRDDGAVRVEVQDFGRWRSPPADPGYRGRGLAVIHTLAREVTLDVTDGGTRIGFTVPRDPPPLADHPHAEGAPQWWRRAADGGARDDR